jgi:hypothetical protein
MTNDTWRSLCEIVQDIIGDQSVAFTQVDKVNRGALFKNEPNHSDYQGELNVAGMTYWINGWIKESKSGSKYMSLSVKPKTAPQKEPQDPRPSTTPAHRRNRFALRSIARTGTRNKRPIRIVGMSPRWAAA